MFVRESASHYAIYGHLYITWSAHAHAPNARGCCTARFYQTANHIFMSDTKGVAKRSRAKCCAETNGMAFSQRLAVLEVAAFYFSWGRFRQAWYQMLFTLTLKSSFSALVAALDMLYILRENKVAATPVSPSVMVNGCWSSEQIYLVECLELKVARAYHQEKTISDGAICGEFRGIEGFTLKESEQE